MVPPLHLSRVLCARLCHDLGGMVGTLEGTLGLAEDDSAMLALARETAEVLGTRLRLYAAAWGGMAVDLDAGQLARLLQGAPAVPRVRFSVVRLAAAGVVPPAVVRVVLNAALLASEALPHGGTVHLSGDAKQALVVQPEGQGAAWSPSLTALLAGVDTPATLDDPRRILAPLLLSLAAETGWALRFDEAQAGQAPALLLRAS